MSSRFRDRVDTKVTFKTPIVNWDVSPKHHEPNIYEKLRRVCDQLDSEGDIGDVWCDPLKKYIRGNFPVSWGVWPRRVHRDADVVFFTAYPDDKTVLGLGGSTWHLTDREEARGTRFSNSSQAALHDFVKDISEQDNADVINRMAGWSGDIGEADYLNRDLTNIVEVEFVARVLEYESEDYRGYRGILGSPLYVAHSGRLSSPLMRYSFTHLRASYARAHTLQTGFGLLSRSLRESDYPTPAQLVAPPALPRDSGQ